MSQSAPSGDWSRRLKGVERLRTEHALVYDILTFYKALLGQQDKLFREAIRSRVFDLAASSEQSQAQKVYVCLERLPRQPRDQAFTAFVKSLPESATEVLQAIAVRLLEAPPLTSQLLAAVVSGQSIDEVAAELKCDRLALEFFPKVLYDNLVYMVLH